MWWWDVVTFCAGVLIIIVWQYFGSFFQYKPFTDKGHETAAFVLSTKVNPVSSKLCFIAKDDKEVAYLFCRRVPQMMEEGATIFLMYMRNDFSSDGWNINWRFSSEVDKFRLNTRMVYIGFGIFNLLCLATALVFWELYDDSVVIFVACYFGGIAVVIFTHVIRPTLCRTPQDQPKILSEDEIAAFQTNIKVEDHTIEEHIHRKKRPSKAPPLISEESSKPHKNINAFFSAV